MIDLWAKPELDVVEAVAAGFGGYFVVETIEKEDVVLYLFI